MRGDHSISLNKYISDTGYCSRREADRLIESGRVTINDQVATKGNRVNEGDVVAIDGERTQTNPKAIYIAYHKPVGVVTTTDAREPANIISAIGHQERLFPVGRLDKASEGLIFLTNDGHMVNKILRADNNHEKEYVVGVQRRITSKFIDQMQSGVNILGTRTKPCQVEKINNHTFNIILTQGLNRQIRRMCAALGNEVTELRRVRIMNVHLGRLKAGRWRNLTTAELDKIRELTKDSKEDSEHKGRTRHTTAKGSSRARKKAGNRRPRPYGDDTASDRTGEKGGRKSKARRSRSRRARKK
ncbi:MAG: pseudouridine synthase [Saprospiraceae bacterium]|nr:pseudouridine synthase [Saprospiraceae bacterium]